MRARESPVFCVGWFFRLRSAQRNAGRTLTTRAKLSLQQNFHPFPATQQPPPRKKNCPPFRQSASLPKKPSFPYGNAPRRESRTLRREIEGLRRERNTLRPHGNAHFLHGKGHFRGTSECRQSALSSSRQRNTHFPLKLARFAMFHKPRPPEPHAERRRCELGL